jgi:isopropylmalate/homocitrate/citramalate synthase
MKEPNYFLDSFPQDTFPRYLWTEKPPHLPVQVWTTETTHRDGQQGGLPLTAEQSLEIYGILCAFTNTSGAIRQAEFFAYRDSDKRALQEALERFRSNNFNGGAPIEPTTWIRAKREDVLLIRSLGVKETGMLASISDYHTFHKFSPGGREQASKSYLEAVEMSLDAGIRPRLHLEDATRADINFVLSFVEAVLEKSASFPSTLRPKFRVCDTMGLGLPYDDVALPRSIPRFFRVLRNAGLGSEDLEFHPHNDTWMIVPNCLAAIREGCAVINGTCLGKGERTGNAPLEAVLMHLIGMGYYQENTPNFKALNNLADLYARMGETLPAKYPLYGKDAHRTRAGIHADGLNKFWWMYAPFNVPDLLGRPLEVSLTKESGLAGLVFVIRQRLGVTLSKDDPALLKVHQWMTEQFDNGRMTSVEWEELEPIVSSVLEPSVV